MVFAILSASDNSALDEPLVATGNATILSDTGGLPFAILGATAGAEAVVGSEAAALVLVLASVDTGAEALGRDDFFVALGGDSISGVAGRNRGSEAPGESDFARGGEG